MSLLSAGEQAQPPVKQLQNESTPEEEKPEAKSPLSFPSPKDTKVPNPMMLPMGIAEEDRSDKKKTKISHLMQQLEGDGGEDDGGELLGLLEAAKSNEGWNKDKTDDGDDLAKLEALMELEVNKLLHSQDEPRSKLTRL
jgi:hypothetical protein